MKEKLLRIREIGKQIAELSQESISIRKEVFEEASSLGLDVPKNEEAEPCSFLVDNIVVSLTFPNTVCFKDMKVIE